MRIVRGKWAGRHLTSPPDRRVRPTAEHVRDAWLAALDPELEGARVLDLFAGTGALGLEAISRGARTADFVETRPSSLHALKANVAALHARDHALPGRGKRTVHEETAVTIYRAPARRAPPPSRTL
jgi:16S rRNA (guanine966-N2)-methyltransferase